MDTFFYCVDYYSNQSCLVFLVWNVLKMRSPIIYVTYKFGMNTMNFYNIKTGLHRNFKRSCDGSQAIFLLTSLYIYGMLRNFKTQDESKRNQSLIQFITTNYLNFEKENLKWPCKSSEPIEIYLIENCSVACNVSIWMEFLLNQLAIWK